MNTITSTVDNIHRIAVTTAGNPDAWRILDGPMYESGQFGLANLFIERNTVETEFTELTESHTLKAGYLPAGLLGPLLDHLPIDTDVTLQTWTPMPSNIPWIDGPQWMFFFLPRLTLTDLVIDHDHEDADFNIHEVGGPITVPWEFPQLTESRLTTGTNYFMGITDTLPELRQP